MNIVISTHFDLAHPVMSIKLDDKNLSGLVDNFAGVFAAYQTSRKTGVPVYFTNFEELEFDGAVDVAKSLNKEETIVIVVDTILEKDTNGKPVSITNAYDIDINIFKNQLENDVHFIDGFFEETEDESWIYGHQFGLKTFYFGIPIPDDYHIVNNKIKIDTIDKAADILETVIEILQEKYQ